MSTHMLSDDFIRDILLVKVIVRSTVSPIVSLFIPLIIIPLFLDPLDFCLYLSIDFIGALVASELCVPVSSMISLSVECDCSVEL